MSPSIQTLAENEEIPAIDRDSLHILPLRIVPLQTRSMKRARLIKNAKLESVIELYCDEITGSGQISVEDLQKELGWPSYPPHHDLILLRRLGGLPSYDVYTLRIALRNMGISIENAIGLTLSQGKLLELTTYMSQFTLPLIQQIYGAENIAITSFEDIVNLFRSPNVSDARSRLQIMAEKLGIQIHDIPRFLEDYGDVFLAVSYYRCCLDQIVPSMEIVLHGINGLQKNRRMQSDATVSQTAEEMVEKLTGLATSVGGCLESFERSTCDLWNNLSAERFGAITDLLQGYYTAIGGALCSLSVKVDAWTTRFPYPESGGSERQAQFLMSEMRQGFDTMEMLDLSPMLAMLNK